MDSYIGEIRMFGGNFAPNGWAFCDGMLYQIAGNEALFSLIGTSYGGDGQQTFALPDLRSRVPMHMGTSNSGSAYGIGQKGGVETVTLTTAQMPSHSHAFLVTTAVGTDVNPGGDLLANSQGPSPYIEEDPDVNLSPGMLSPVGGSQPHDNRQPYLGINFIIALTGIYPPRQ